MRPGRYVTTLREVCPATMTAPRSASLDLHQPRRLGIPIAVAESALRPPVGWRAGQLARQVRYCCGTGDRTDFLCGMVSQTAQPG